MRLHAGRFDGLSTRSIPVGRHGRRWRSNGDRNTAVKTDVRGEWADLATPQSGDVLTAACSRQVKLPCRCHGPHEPQAGSGCYPGTGRTAVAYTSCEVATIRAWWSPITLNEGTMLASSHFEGDTKQKTTPPKKKHNCT